MTSPLAIVALGFFIGMRHATDADHVIAVMTIVSRQRSLKPAAWVGALWGVGHTVTIVAVGAAIILFNVAIPVHLGLLAELAVGVMLVGLGISNVVGTARRSSPRSDPAHPAAFVHSHAHGHGDYVHTHPHGHTPDVHPHDPTDTPLARADRAFHRLAPYRLMRPLIVGVVHGLAGLAAVVLLVLAAIRDPFWAMVYLFVFGLGTVAGMVVLTTLAAAPLAYSNRQFVGANRRLQLATGVLSLGFGLVMAYRIGFAHAPW